MRIMAIGAHPDDIEISCAGTLAKLKQAGHEVTLCHASDGDKGHFEIPPDELVRIRRSEAQQSGRLIDSPVISMGLKDGEIVASDKEIRLQFIDTIRRVKPDIVITHAPNDYMPDHNAVSQLVFDTTFLATIPNFSTEHSIITKVPSLYYMDNLAGVGFEPTFYVDISDTIETKLNMLKCHRSQQMWLQSHDHVDILDFVTTLSKVRGMQSGCLYAEGFIQRMAWTRPNAVRFPV